MAISIPVATGSDYRCEAGGTVEITVQPIEGATFAATVEENKGSARVNGTTITYTAHSPVSTESVNVSITASKADPAETSEALVVPVTVEVASEEPTPSTTTLVLTPADSVTVTLDGEPVEVLVETNADDFTVEGNDDSKLTVQKESGKITLLGIEQGVVNLTIRATAAESTEAVKTLAVTIREASQVVVVAPVLTDSGEKSVNENESIVIAFNTVEGGTLNASVEGGEANGTVSVDGFNVTYTAPAVEGSKVVVVKATVSKDGETSAETSVNVNVVDVPVSEPEVVETTLSVNVSQDPILVGDRVRVEVETNASDYTVNEFNTDVATYDKSTNTITCHAEGDARFIFRATAENSIEKTAEINIKVKTKVMLEVIPSTITINQFEESIDFLINTDADAVSAVVTNEDIATYDSETRKVTGVAVGSTEITFTGSKANKVDTSVVVPITVNEEVIYIPKLLSNQTSVVGGDVLDLRFVTPQTGATLSARVENEEAGTVRVDGDTVYFESKNVTENKLSTVYVKTVKGVKESAEITVPVLVTARPKTKITIEGPSKLKVGDSYDYKVVTEASSFVIESSAPDIAAVENDLVVAKAAGEVVITARATAANKLEGTATITATVTEKVKGTKPRLLTDPSRLTIERAKELTLEFQLVTNEVLVGEVDPSLGSISIVNNIATVYLLPNVVSDTVLFTFKALSVDNVESDPLEVTVTVNKLKDLMPVPVTPVVNKIKIEENMSYEVLLNTSLAGIKYKLFANPNNIVDVNTQTMTIIGNTAGDGYITIVASAIGYDNNIINIPVTVTEDPDEEVPEVPENPDQTGPEEISEQAISDLLNKKGIPVREKLDTIKKSGPLAFKAIVNKLDSYNEQMNPAVSNLDNKQCANKNFELYTMIKNATNVADNSSFSLRFDIINLYFKEYKNEAFDEFALFRADDAWTWGDDSLQTYQNLITIITSLCDITTRANNIRTIDVAGSLNKSNIDLTLLSKQNIVGYYTE